MRSRPSSFAFSQCDADHSTLRSFRLPSSVSFRHVVPKSAAFSRTPAALLGRCASLSIHRIHSKCFKVWSAPGRLVLFKAVNGLLTPGLCHLAEAAVTLTQNRLFQGPEALGQVAGQAMSTYH